MKVVKRGKGKIKSNKGNIDIFNYYKKNYKNPVDKHTYLKVLDDLNNTIRNRIVNESEDFKLPYRLGILRIKKFQQDLYKRPKHKWPVDYQKSKELGYIVYHEHDYVYKWYWDKRKAIVKWRTAYFFKPCRKAKRVISIAIKSLKKDYFS